MTAALQFRDLTLGYDRHPAVHHVSAEIPAAEMTAIVGPNGAGKSTLLKILAGVLDFEGGARELGSNVRVAYFAQHQIEALNPDNTVFNELNDAAPMMSTTDMRKLLGAFLFSGSAVTSRSASFRAESRPGWPSPNCWPIPRSC